MKIQGDKNFPVPVGALNPDGTVGDQTYPALGTAATPVTANGSGAPIGPIKAGSYALLVEGVFDGATVKVDALGADGVTWYAMPSVSVTVAGTTPQALSVGFVALPGAIVRATLSGVTANTSVRARIG